MRLPKELNSQVPVKQAEPYADTTLESPLNGRRRCTNVVDVFISQANGQSNSSSSAAFKAGEYLYRFFAHRSCRYSGGLLVFHFTIRGRGRILCWSF